MREEPIVEIPGHITALPEAEQGPALVEEILARKKVRNIRESFLQRLVWGEVQTDGHGNVIPRREPEYWASVQQALVSGEPVEYTQRINEPGEVRVGRGPEAKVIWHDEHQFLVGGRGHGKTYALQRQRETAMLMAKWLHQSRTWSAPLLDTGNVRWAVRP